MDSSINLETSKRDARPSSIRSSYASIHSRNSYASISEGSTDSARTSYSSVFDPPNRAASFSRTVDSFFPDSLSSSSDSPKETSPESSRRNSLEAIADTDRTSHSLPKESPKSNVRSESKDGPSALKDLENVKDIICVAFGAFDRYYISWEDSSGEFHQESHKLPEDLYRWLFPKDGKSRHLPTLQVSFGSNNEFFASDKLGKISNRDSTTPSEKKAPPTLANVARGLMRKKAYTVSSPTVPLVLQPSDEQKLASPRLERRKTYLEGQPSPRADSARPTGPMADLSDTTQKTRSLSPTHERRRSILPLSESQLTRLEPRSETTKHERRQSILINPLPLRARPSWPDRKSVLMMRERLQPQMFEVTEGPRPTPSYVDSAVQTDTLVPEPQGSTPPTAYGMNIPPQHFVGIGAMSDFFRGQYRLGDALGFV